PPSDRKAGVAEAARSTGWARRSESRPIAARKVDHLGPDGGLAGSRDPGCAEGMLRMDQVHVVRHKVLVEGRTQRAVARELGLARVTVRKYLDQAAPRRKSATPRPRP